jgi:hypothetical protein
MPSLFAPDETVYDKYAACLAATEGLRRIRDREQVQEAASKTNTDSILLVGSSTTPTEREQKITRDYVQNSAKVIQAMGLSVKQFNDLGKQISKDERLREKVRRNPHGLRY